MLEKNTHKNKQTNKLLKTTGSTFFNFSVTIQEQFWCATSSNATRNDQLHQKPSWKEKCQPRHSCYFVDCGRVFANCCSQRETIQPWLIPKRSGNVAGPPVVSGLPSGAHCCPDPPQGKTWRHHPILFLLGTLLLCDEESQGNIAHLHKLWYCSTSWFSYYYYNNEITTANIVRLNFHKPPNKSLSLAPNEINNSLSLFFFLHSTSHS